MDARMAEATRASLAGAPPAISEPRATEDALQALRFVRANAAKWSIDPARVGMIGFSAGAMTTLNAVFAPDSAARPAFVGYIYGPMNARAIPADAPPMFSAIALDDELFRDTGFGLVESWRKAGRPVEFHGYERGHHGFGTGVPGTTTILMLDEFRAWMKARGLLENGKWHQ
jgi:acetyl esterase/lipase